MDKFNEEATQRDDLEPDVEFIDEEGFIEHCLDLFDVIKHGSRKQRKRAAQELVFIAVGMKDLFMETDDKLLQAEKELRAFQDAEFKDDENEKGPDPSHLYTPGAETAATCVINEHAHGDDHNVSSPTDNPPADMNWAHSDPTVDAKLNSA